MRARGTAAVLSAILVIAVAVPAEATLPELDLALARLDSLSVFSIQVVRQLSAFGTPALPPALDRLDSQNRPTALAAAMVVGELGDRTLACNLLERWARASHTGSSLGPAVALKMIILKEGRSPLQRRGRDGYPALESALLDTVFCVGPSASLADTLHEPPLVVWVGFPGSEREWHLSCGAEVMNSEALPTGDGTDPSQGSPGALFQPRLLTLEEECFAPASTAILGAPPSHLAVVCVQQLPLHAHKAPHLPFGCDLWALCSGHWHFMQKIE